MIRLTKADVGKRYKTRDGSTATLTGVGGVKKFPFEFKTDDGSSFTSNENGRVCVNPKNDWRHDLISRVTCGRPKGAKKAAPFEQPYDVSPIHELEHLEKAYDAFMTLDEFARKRGLDWLVDKLKA